MTRMAAYLFVFSTFGSIWELGATKMDEVKNEVLLLTRGSLVYEFPNEEKKNKKI